MLTFEIILHVFEDILRQDPLYEVVSTSHGYTLLAWDAHRNQWYSAELLETPEAMLNALLDVYSSYLESELLGNERDDLTEQEEEEIQARCRQLRKKCFPT
ncbi:MAG: hypothetical protein IJX67_00150 [Oscillospiraceae bacterium]|nr:hypothetical protein [Oscillospiraceae bacterium]